MDSSFVEWLDVLDIVFGPIVALIGLIITIPLLKKKLIENHVTQKLNEIQKYNSKIYHLNLKVTEKYILLLGSSNSDMSLHKFKRMALEIRKIYYTSFKASSEVHTLLHYLNIILRRIIIDIDKKQHKIVFPSTYARFAIDVLYKVNYYSTMVVPVTKSYELQKENIIKKPINKYVTYGDVLKYKHFNLGLALDVNSAQFLIFSDLVNRTNIPLLMRAAFKIYRKPNAILKILYKDKIYAPYKLNIPNHSIFTNDKSLPLYLIGYSFSNIISFEKEDISEEVELIYCNIDDSISIESSRIFEKYKDCLSDPVIGTSCFDIYRASDKHKSGYQYFTLGFEKSYLHELFKMNKWQMSNLIRI